MHAECTEFRPVLLMIVLAVEMGWAHFYNRWVARHQAENGGIYTSIYVAGGILMTVLVAAPVIGLWSALLVLAAFGASGLPMMIGSMNRHSRRIKKDVDETIAGAREILRERSDGAETKT